MDIETWSCGPAPPYLLPICFHQDAVPQLEIPTTITDANEAQATEAYAHAWCRFVGVCCNVADEDERVSDRRSRRIGGPSERRWRDGVENTGALLLWSRLAFVLTPSSVITVCNPQSSHKASCLLSPKSFWKLLVAITEVR
jgi:hypothetical protein